MIGRWVLQLVLQTATLPVRDLQVVQQLVSVKDWDQLEFSDPRSMKRSVHSRTRTAASLKVSQRHLAGPCGRQASRHHLKLHPERSLLDSTTVRLSHLAQSLAPQRTGTWLRKVEPAAVSR